MSAVNPQIPFQGTIFCILDEQDEYRGARDEWRSFSSVQKRDVIRLIERVEKHRNIPDKLNGISVVFVGLSTPALSASGAEQALRAGEVVRRRSSKRKPSRKNSFEDIGRRTTLGTERPLSSEADRVCRRD